METLAQWTRGHPALAALIAVVVFALLALAFVFLARRRPQRLHQGHELVNNEQAPRRLHQRHGLVRDVQVSWNGPAGELRHCDGRCRDSSAGGLGIELPESLPIDTPVTLRITSLNFTGTGVVRHSRRLASGYLVGIGFSRLTRVLAGFPTFAPPSEKEFPSDS